MKRFTFNQDVKLYRNGDEVCTDNPNDMQAFQEPVNTSEFLLSIKLQRAIPSYKYCIEVDAKEAMLNNQPLPIEKDKNNPLADKNNLLQQGRRHNIYLIVRSLKDNQGKSQVGYPLLPGNVIKLGRIEYRVVEIRSGTGTERDLNFGQEEPEVEFDVDNQKIPAETEMMCRYCLYEQKDNNVPTVDQALLFCCSCSGSAGGVHFQCLKNWIKNKIVSKTNNNTVTYQWKKFECEVCKTPLPRKVMFHRMPHELINIERPDCPYIILEKIPGASEPQKGATLSLIVPTDNETIKLGRGHQCDLRISDISVSRIHAFLRYKDNQFRIFDNESKFGTLIQLNQDYEITKDKAAIQIGRTVFTFVMKDAHGHAGQADREN